MLCSRILAKSTAQEDTVRSEVSSSAPRKRWTPTIWGSRPRASRVRAVASRYPRDFGVCLRVGCFVGRSVGLCERERAALGPVGALGEGYGSRALTEACA